jgi:hypothetical protein
MHVAAFDIATKCGCCDGAPGAVPRCWTWHMVGPSREWRYGQFLSYCDSYFAECVPDAVFYELPMVLFVPKARNEDVVSVLRGMIAILCASAARAGVGRIHGVDVQDARRAFLGHSPARGEGKQNVWDMCKILGWKPANFDESDAACIWSYGCCLMNPRTAHLSTELFAGR